MWRLVAIAHLGSRAVFLCFRAFLCLRLLLDFRAGGCVWLLGGDASLRSGWHPLDFRLSRLVLNRHLIVFCLRMVVSLNPRLHLDRAGLLLLCVCLCLVASRLVVSWDLLGDGGWDVCSLLALILEMLEQETYRKSSSHRRYMALL